MAENKELQNAWELIEQTDTSVFLTGKAGTGKTTFLKTLKECSNKRMVVVAPTGVAAINAQGVTIHSFFQLPLTPFVPEMQLKNRFDYSAEKKKIIRTIDLLIIDEISMVRADVLDAIDSVMRKFRDKRLPFGGVQLLMIGDLQQLTPVVTPSDEALLGKYYPTPYFFSSKALAMVNFATIELKQIYRQQDENFIRLLNNIREGRLSEDDNRLLNERVCTTFKPEQKSDYILLTTHNRTADNYNSQQLNGLNQPSFTFRAATSGVFPEISFPAEAELTLKKDAQVMFIRNDSNGKYYNGKIGHISFINQNTIFVRCPGDEEDIVVTPEVWENTKYTLNENTKQIEPQVQGTFTQYPLRLAWAITIHKSQGLTFEHAIIDAGRAFASGQVYVALSRCKSLAGMVLTEPLSKASIMRNNDVNTFLSQQEELSRQTIGSIGTLKQAYYKKLLQELFYFNDMLGAEETMLRLLSEHFVREKALIVLHQTCIAELKTKVANVAEKWLHQMAAMNDADLHSAAFLERVKKGSLYFYETFTELFSTLFIKTRELQPANKQLAKRLKNAFSEQEQIVKAKQNLLKQMLQADFSIPFYLQAKQKAMLEAMGEEPKKQRSKAEKDGKSSKVPKTPTADVSFNLFLSGKSIAQIAKERGLTAGTITTHLLKFVALGKLNVNQIIPQSKITTIENIIKKVGADNGLTAIKALCPEDITFDDIRIVLKSRKN